MPSLFTPPDELTIKATAIQKTLRCRCGAEFSVKEIAWCLRHHYHLPRTCWDCKHGLR